MWAARKAFLFIILAVVIVSGCSQTDEVIATYEGGEVTKGEFDGYVGAMLFFNYGLEPFVGEEVFRETTLTQLIAIKVLAETADADVQSVQKKAAEEEFQLLRQNFYSQYGQSAWDNLLSDLKTNDEHIQTYIERSNVIGEVLGADIEEADLQQLFLERNEEHAFDQISLRHILIAVIDPASAEQELIRSVEEAQLMAEEVQQKLAEGQDFAELAQQYSDDTGPMQRGALVEDMLISQLPVELRQAVAELSVGQVSEPITTEIGVHLLKLESRETPVYEELDSRVLESLRAEMINQRFIQYIEEELPAKQVQIDR